MVKEFMKEVSLTYQQLLLDGLADLVEEGEGGLVLAHHHQVHGPVPCYMSLIIHQVWGFGSAWNF
jgi:hypothetical protein